MARLTAANALTAGRLLCAPILALCIADQRWPLAAGLFALAAVSDALDGPLARRYQQASSWGGLFDHATDAVFVTLGLAAFAWLGQITPLLPVLIAASFAQYALDSGAPKGRALRASWLGRCNGIAYYVLLGFLIGQPALSLPLIPAPVLSLIAWLLVVTSLASMADRFIASRRAGSDAD